MLLRLLFASLGLFFISHTQAAVYRVSHQLNDSAHFASVQSAIEFASAHDTIFVHGSPVNYGNILLEKPLVLIGEGFSGQNKSGHTSKLSRVLLTYNAFKRSTSSGSKIMGFEFPYYPGERPNILTVPDPRVSIDHITLERNWLWYIQIGGKARSWEIRHNVIRGWLHGGARIAHPESGAVDFLVSNNIIQSLRLLRHPNRVEHNIVLGSLSEIEQLTFVHNIFIGEEGFLQGVQASVFRNNIASAVRVGGDVCLAELNRFESASLCGHKANTGSGNRVGMDPGFLGWPAQLIEGGAVFQLKPGSPARRAGVAGAELGIFGGVQPFPLGAFVLKEIADPFSGFLSNLP